jgi:hypothetical protein
MCAANGKNGGPFSALYRQRCNTAAENAHRAQSRSSRNPQGSLRVVSFLALLALNNDRFS